jgi:hypothetical protein
MAWGGFADKNSSNYLRLLAKIERTIQNLEELLKYTPTAKQSVIKQAIELLADLPNTIQEDHP